MLSEKENILRVIEFRYPEWIPIEFSLMESFKLRHGARLADMMLRHPLLFTPEQVRSVAAAADALRAFKERRFTDDWGCEWLEIEAGICGQVVNHPLSDWQGLGRLRVPDPSRQCDWAGIRCRCRQERERGKLCAKVDIDEQMLPFASPDEIDAQIREIIAHIGLPEGGLMLYACPSADVPIENIEAICTAWERYGSPGRWSTT